MKVVVNKCYGGFGLSYDAVMRYAQIKGIKMFAFVEKGSTNQLKEYKGGEAFSIYYSTKPLKNGKLQEKYYFSYRDIDRDDPTLVQVVKELKKKANGTCAKLEIVEIPDGVEWEIEEYDGNEWVSEAHRTW